jgi:hypothetical protein
MELRTVSADLADALCPWIDRTWIRIESVGTTADEVLILLGPTLNKREMSNGMTAWYSLKD